MIKGIGGQPYITLDEYLDIEGFKKLHPEICKGFALAREYAKEGTWMEPGFNLDDMSYTLDWKPIYKAFKEYKDLPENDPIKISGKELFPKDFKDYKQRYLFKRYLKSALVANDPYIYYFLCEEGNWDIRDSQRKKTEESKYFPNVVKWVENLVQQNIISHIGRVIFFHCEHDGKAFEHRDMYAIPGETQDYKDNPNEFIHVRNNTKRGFYLWDPEKRSKTYINSNSSWWNDQDWHGGETSKEQEYGLRIDCKFTDEFKKKLNLN